MLRDLGFVSQGKRGELLGGETVNAQATCQKTIKAALCAGLYPNVVRVVHPQATYIETASGAVRNDNRAREVKLFPKAPGRVFLHPSSVCFDVGRYEDPQIVYHTQVMTNKVFLRDASMVGAYPLLMFGGKLTVEHEHSLIVVDGWYVPSSPRRSSPPP